MTNATKIVDDSFEYGVNPDGSLVHAVPPPPPPKETAEGEVSEIAKKRNEADAATLLSKGFDLGADTVFAIGTRVSALGDSNQKLYRQQWEKQPLSFEAMEAILGKVESEKRVLAKDIVVSDITVDDDTGVLTLNDNWTVDASHTAMKHLAGFLSDDSGLAGYLPWAPNHLRSQIVDYYTGRLTEEEADAARAVLAKEPGAKLKEAIVNVAVKTGLEVPTAYRIASRQYKPFEVDTAFKSILGNKDLEKLLADSRAEVMYNGEQTRITMLWHSDEIIDKAAGDVFKVGIQLTLDDVKASSIKVTAIAYRNLCMNYIIIGRATKTMVRQRHAGLNIDFAKLIGQGITQAAVDFDSFRSRWSDARRDRILDSFNGNAETVFQGLVGAGLVHVPGRTKEAKVETLMKAYAQEPGPSRCDIVNAVTRAAHEATWYSDIMGSGETEAEGAQLVYVKNLVNRVSAGVSRYQDGY